MQAYFAALEAGHTGTIATLPPALQGGVTQQVRIFVVVLLLLLFLFLLLLLLLLLCLLLLLLPLLLVLLLLLLLLRLLLLLLLLLRDCSLNVQAASSGGSSKAVDDLMRALLLVRSYEMRGHNIAKVCLRSRIDQM